MNFLKSFDISASGLTAQRMRMDVISQNIANAESTRSANGRPYRRKVAVLEEMTSPTSFGDYLNELKGSRSAKGVVVKEIVEDNSPYKVVHDPTHPDADENGNVTMPNVDTLREMIDMISATRAYEANLTAFNTMKNMLIKALDMGR